VPPLSPEQARDLYVAFLDDVAGLVTSLAREKRGVELCLDGPANARELPPRARLLPRTLQGPGDLGQRLRSAFERAHREGATATVIVGADAPDLPAARVQEAFGALADADATIAGAEDGGYVLIGLRRPASELFREIPWGGPGVAQATRRRARDAGLSLVELPPWRDVDDAAALRRLRSALATARDDVAPATRAHFQALDGLYSTML